MTANVLSPVVGHIRRYPVDMKKWGSYFPKGKKTLADTMPESKEWVTAELLIGGDYYEKIVLAGKKPIGKSGLFLRNSKLGKILTGATESSAPRDKEAGGYFSLSDSRQHIEYSLDVATYVTQEIPELQMFWSPDPARSFTPDFNKFSSLEGIGISGPGDVSENDLSIQNFNESIESDGKRYFVTWPWKDKNPELPEN